MPTRLNKSLDHRYVKLSGPGADDIYCIGARHREALSTMPEVRMEFFSTKSDFEPQDVLGKSVTLTTDGGFKVTGIFVSVEELGFSDTDVIFAAEIRPKHWLTTLGSNNRVYQAKSTIEIIKDVLKDVDATEVKSRVSGTYQPREYCVQYGETNFAFISRLLEEDGIYYYFDYSGKSEEMVLCDSVSGHTNVGNIPFMKSSNANRAQDTESILTWTDVGRVTAGKVSLFDYDPLKPKIDLKVNSPVGADPANKKVEVYATFGHYDAANDGVASARKVIDGLVADTKRFKGTSNHPNLATGAIFTLDHPDRSAVNGDYLVAATTHYMLGDQDPPVESLTDVFHAHVERIAFPDKMVFFQTEFDVMPKATPYRPKRQTPWPEVPGLLTAIVTGKVNENIHTDKHGRIKIMFPWDRDGKGDEKTSCWVRVVMPWAGNEWGWQSIPRKGMEVIIQFERGNIDRPICTGMVYNADNKLPFDLPDEMTKTGLRTRSTKDGTAFDEDGTGFHELSFDDKKNSEAIFFQSEKDYKQIVKNNAEIIIGSEKHDKGSLTQTIKRDKIETIMDGDTKLDVKKGNRITKVKTDDTTTIEGKSTTEVTGDTKLTVKTGSAILEVQKAHQKTTVSLGNITVDATAGKITLTAGLAIELKVGGSSIKIDPAGVTITGAKVTLDGKATTEVKAPVVEVKGMGMVTVSGPMIMIG
jgi:type VI secretion system secreted protein VgrG